MADETYDFCECVYNQLVMQRLLLFLRQTQDQCTDTECFVEPILPQRCNVSTFTDFYTMALVIGFVALMYICRPNSLRPTRHVSTKNSETVPRSSRDPPPPPALD